MFALIGNRGKTPGGSFYWICSKPIAMVWVSLDQPTATYDYPDCGFGSMPNEQVHRATLVMAASTAHVMPVAEMAHRITRLMT
jgi:hypothetical protein